jgi:hypothetical protein
MKIKATEPILDLKEPIKSTDFVSLDKIKNQQETVGLKAIDENKHMPRVDKEVALQKIEAATKQDASLTLSDWQWLKDVYKQAVLLDEINRRAARQDKLASIKLTDTEHSKTLSEMTIDKRVAANIKAAKELQRIRNEQLIRADVEWREWINKLDHKTITNKQELLEGFMKALGYKLGFVRQAWNQRHLTEIKKSLSKLSIEQQAEAQRLHIQHEYDLRKMKQEIAYVKKDAALRQLSEALVARLFDVRVWKDYEEHEHARVESLLLLRAQGFKTSVQPLPSRLLELQKVVDNHERLRLNLEKKERENLIEFRNQLAELQSAALSNTGKQHLFKLIDSRQLDKNMRADNVAELKTTEYFYKQAKSLLAAVGYNLNRVPLPWKRLEIEEEKMESSELLNEKANQHKKDVDSLFKEISASKTEQQMNLLHPTENPAKKTNHQKPDEPLSALASKELSPLKPKPFKPNFPSMSPKPHDINEQDEQLARLQTEKEQQLLEATQEVQLKLAQMQVAAQIAQAEAFNVAPKPAVPGEQQLKIDIKQKVKAAK